MVNRTEIEINAPNHDEVMKVVMKYVDDNYQGRKVSINIKQMSKKQSWKVVIKAA